MSVGDFATTLMGFKTPFLNFLGGVISVILKVAGFIYSSKAAVLLLAVIMLFDWASGVYKTIKNGTFNSFTFQRMLINIFFTMIVIAIAYHMSLAMPLIAWLMLPEFLIGGFMVTYFFSIFENLHQADSKLIPEKMYKHLKWLLDLDRIVPAYFKSKTTPHLKEENKGEPENEAETK
ncbi:hypothetical protein GCM10027293_03630 [Pontibacter aydingkolensis]